MSESPGVANAGETAAVIERIGRRSVDCDCAEAGPNAFALESVHVSEPAIVSVLLSNVARRARYAASVSPAFGAIGGTV